MSTAKHIINRAASFIGVKREGSDLTDEEYADSLDTLNDFVVELQARDVKFHIEVAQTIDDDIGEYSWVSGYLKTQLAKRLAPEFSVPVPPDLHQFARTAERSLLRRIQRIENVYKPPLLPVGSGNHDSGGITCGNEFYGDPTADDLETASGQPLLTELGGKILKGGK